MTELSRAEFPNTYEVLEAGVKAGVAPGFVAGVWDGRQPELFRVAAFGSRRIEPSVLPMLADTIFDIASVSKVFATATLAAALVERGWIGWDTPLAAILGDYVQAGKSPWRAEIRLEHLLSHTAGFPWWQPYYEKLRDRFAPTPLWKVSIARRQAAMRELVFATEPQVAPGEKTEYSDVSFLLLGFALETVTQMPLDQAVRRFVWNPLGLEGPAYRKTHRPPQSLDEEVAATELSPWHGTVLQGQVHDENCWAMGGYGGHAGVFARAEDLLRFSRAFFHGFLSPKTRQEMWTRMSRPLGCERTRGWDTPSAQGSSAGQFFLPGSVGHLGFTGTSLWIDPQARVAVTLLSNRVHTTRENIEIRRLRPAFHDAVRRDLKK